MVITLNEIKKRATEFSHAWKNETDEKAEAQSFWNDFFEVFGVQRRRVASFEKPALKFNGGKGFIDLLWRGKLVAEHKSAGANLDKAYSQALDYFNGLTDEELPRYVIVTDFANMRLYDLDNDNHKDFMISDLVDNIGLFDFISGHERILYKKEDPVNIKASELMGKLHEALRENGYEGHDLETLLVRLMFCLFADDTDIFEKGQFRQLIESRTSVDGNDTGLKIIMLFEVLNIPEQKRQKNLDEELRLFPYIDGSLFEERIHVPSFDSEGRQRLLDCCQFDWSKVSPAIFGSLFQSVMNQNERHEVGGHYTSEKNILKTVDAVFLNSLNTEFEQHKNNKKYLENMLQQIGKIKILDPACGCGNFLMISYRELRRLQIRVHLQLRKLQGSANQRVLDITAFDSDLDVDSVYGIELLEFPAKIAQVGLWLTDHLVNRELSKEFGLYYRRLPLKKTANITVANALRLDWNAIIPKGELTYILGNPPFISKQDRTAEQQEDMANVCKDINNYGLLDYVCCWYIKASEYIKNTPIQVGLVSTNAITHGEQVGVLWDYLFKNDVKINFAHRTFKWLNDAKGLAQVHVVIIGFSHNEVQEKFLYEYETPNSEPMKIKAENINPYLIDFKNILIFGRNSPICKVPRISFGSMPNDDGNFLFSDTERSDFLKLEPEAVKFFKPLICAKEYLHGEKRWCLWLKGATPSEINNLKLVKERVSKVKQYRQQSKRGATVKLASTPALFGEDRQPETDYLFIPLHTSENRKYIPMAFLTKDDIANNSCSLIPNAGLYHFGVLMSDMHMVWMRAICGRIKSDYRYSNNLVYNNYPWPDIDDDRAKRIAEAAKEVLVARSKYNSCLADIYGPLSMPKELLQAHRKLDTVVERCFSSKPLKSDLDKLEILFGLYDRYATT